MVIVLAEEIHVVPERELVFSARQTVLFGAFRGEGVVFVALDHDVVDQAVQAIRCQAYADGLVDVHDDFCNGVVLRHDTLSC